MSGSSSVRTLGFGGRSGTVSVGFSLLPLSGTCRWAAAAGLSIVRSVAGFTTGSGFFNFTFLSLSRVIVPGGAD